MPQFFIRLAFFSGNYQFYAMFWHMCSMLAQLSKDQHMRLSIVQRMLSVKISPVLCGNVWHIDWLD